MSENYKTLKRQEEINLLTKGSTQIPKNVQPATIINCGGENLLRIYYHFIWENEQDKNDPAIVFRKIKEYCNPRKIDVA
mgnify:CR=1 FL=1